MSAALWLLVGLPAAAALLAALLPRLRAAIAPAAALATTLWALAVCGGLAEGATASLPWIAARGLEVRLVFDPLAIPGVLLTCLATLAVALDRRIPAAALPGVLLGAALALAVWLAGDLGLMIAALGGLGLLAPLLARGRGPAAIAVALPLGIGVAAFTVGALLLVLGRQEALGGAWTFATAEVLAVALPAPTEALAGGALLASTWLLAGAWPVDGGWREATRAAPPGVDAWIPAVIRPLGLWVLVRIALPAGGGPALAAAPWLAWGAALGVALAALQAWAEVDPRLRLHLGHLPIGLGIVGALTVSAEGTVGALLLALAGGLSFVLAGSEGGAGEDLSRGAGSVGSNLSEGSGSGGDDLSRGPGLGRAARVGLLGLAGVPGLAGAAGALLVVLALLGHGRWALAGAPWLAALAIAATVAGIAATLRRRRLDPGGQGASGARAAREFALSRAEDAGHSAAAAPGRLAAALLLVALIALGLRPTLVTGRMAPAAAAWMNQVHARWCRDLVAPALRPTVDPAPGCEAPIPTVRARLRAEEARR